MTRFLILMRHAKSSWAQPDLADHDRPLNGRGRRSAKALGDWLRDQGWVPDNVLCSTSQRTRETLARLAVNAPVSFEHALFHATPKAMAQVLSHASGNTILMIGHNPGIADFAHAIVSAPPDHPRFADYPTGATLVARFDGGWSGGAVADFVIPRDLPGVAG